MNDEYGDPVAPTPLGDAVDELAEIVGRVAKIGVETQAFAEDTRTMLEQLAHDRDRNWLGVRVALACIGALILLGTAVVWSLYIGQARQSDRIADVLVRVQMDRERSIRDGCEARNQDHATLLQLVREARPGPGFVARAERVLGQADCDALVELSRRAVGVPPKP